MARDRNVTQKDMEAHIEMVLSRLVDEALEGGSDVSIQMEHIRVLLTHLGLAWIGYLELQAEEEEGK